jgi:NAD-reducing hydrogenase large subunit
MSRTVLIDPVTRVEGHAKITIHLDDGGHVSDARFHVAEFRGFEKFREGRLFDEGQRVRRVPAPLSGVS